MRTPLFQMQMPILEGVRGYFAPPSVAVLAPSTSAAAAPCLELVRSLLKRHIVGLLHGPGAQGALPQGPELTVPRMPQCTALQARNGKGARIGLDEATSHGSGSPSRSRWW